MKRPGPTPPPRLLDGPEARLSTEDAGTAAALARLHAPQLDRVAQERVWRAVAASLPPRRRRALWLLLPAGVALAAALIVIGLRPRSAAAGSAIARVALTAGHVLSAAPRQGWATATAGAALPEASRLHTEAQARTVAVLGDSQILLAGDSDLGLDSVGRSTFLRLSRGEVVCQVAPRKAGESFVVQTTRYRVTVKGTIFAVRERAEDDVDVSVSRGLVEVTGQEGRWLVPAGSAWHSRTPDAPAADDILPEQRSLLQQAAAATATERAVIAVEGAPGVEVSEGGVHLGPTPVSWDAPVGTYHFVGSAAGTVEVSPAGEGNVVTSANTRATVLLEPSALDASKAAAPALNLQPTAEGAAARAPTARLPGPVEPPRATIGPRAKPASPRQKSAGSPGGAPPASIARGDAVTRLPATPAATLPAAPAASAVASRAPEPPLLARLEPRATAPSAPEAFAAPAPAPQVAAPPLVLATDPYAAALGLARTGDPRAAATALQGVVDARGAHADLALYELGRLRQQKLADPMGALQAYRDYEKAYPRGALSQEVGISAIEIELQAQDLAGALSEIDRFLDAHGKSERAPEVHLLRGDVLSKRGDDAAALREYRRAEAQGTGDVAAEGLYRGAACAERLGDTDGAGAALRSYLSRYPDGPHAKEAAAALGEKRSGR